MYFVFNKFGIVLQDGYTHKLVQSFGVFGPLVFCLLYLSTLVFAPLPGTPFLVSGIGLFGVVDGVLLIYSVDILSAVVNFYIARRFGRGVMRRFVGERGLNRIDGHVSEFSVEMLILARLFEGTFFEWISYAAGLTKIKFKKYFIITILGAVPERALKFLLAATTADLGRLFIQIAFAHYILMVIPFLYYFIKKLVVRKRAVEIGV